ncbi:Unknown protein, partial [Striga hermonthica]
SIVHLVTSARNNAPLSGKRSPYEWMYDSGASHHMTGYLKFFFLIFGIFRPSL